MDRRVKERLVGASILVILIVLVVPELLSGPVPGPSAPRAPVSNPEPIRNVTVDLAAGKPLPMDDEASVSASAAAPTAAGPVAPAVAPAVAAGGASTAATTATPAAAAAAPTSEPVAASTPVSSPHTAAANPPAAVETPSPSPTSMVKPAVTSRGWAVQLGSFASRANADKLARQVKSQGFPVYVSAVGSGKAARYRVRIGPLADRGSAGQTLGKLKSLGHAGSLVTPNA